MTKTAIVQVEHCSQCPHLSKAYAEPDACSLAPTLLGGAWSDYLTPKRGIAEFCPLPDSET